MTKLPRQSDADPPRGELVGVEASERDAQVTIAKRFAGPEDYVTVVARAPSPGPSTSTAAKPMTDAYRLTDRDRGVKRDGPARQRSRSAARRSRSAGREARPNDSTPRPRPQSRQQRSCRLSWQPPQSRPHRRRAMQGRDAVARAEARHRVAWLR